MTDVIEQAAKVAGAIEIPVITDADTGYGGAVNIWETVRGLERAGLGGLHLEDQRMPKKCGAMAGKELVGDDEMAARLRVALGARQSPDFLIIGRTDAVTVMGVAEAARRCVAMAAAGADAVMVPSLASPQDLETIARSVDIPVIYVAAETVRPMYDAEALTRFGFAMALYPLSLIQVSAAAQFRLLTTLRDTGTTEGMIPEMMPFARVGELAGNAEAAGIERPLRPPRQREGGMPQTLSEKIFARTGGNPAARAGEVVWAAPDLITTPEVSFPAYIKRLRSLGLDRLAAPERIVVAIDHEVPVHSQAGADRNRLTRTLGAGTGSGPLAR